MQGRYPARWVMAMAYNLWMLGLERLVGITYL